MFFVKIDARERELIPLIREKLGETTTTDQITISVESLPLGDIIFCKDEQELLIIERKSVADLAASIKDGRYQEQSYRLDGTDLHNHNIVYLIEGNMARATFDKSALYSAMFSLQYYKGFSVWRTFSIDETATILCNSIKYLVKSSATRTGYYAGSSASSGGGVASAGAFAVGGGSEEPKTSSDKDYVSVVKTIKKDNVTPNNIGEIMLCQIPGVSAGTALAIMAHFKCMVNLIADLQEHGASCLEKVELKNAKGVSRKLNKTCVANIVKFLLQE
jgi:ERCC4-type nuclease